MMEDTIKGTWMFTFRNTSQTTATSVVTISILQNQVIYIKNYIKMKINRNYLSSLFSDVRLYLNCIR